VLVSPGRSATRAFRTHRSGHRRHPIVRDQQALSVRRARLAARVGADIERSANGGRARHHSGDRRS
jgi:hypothetical protein